MPGSKRQLVALLGQRRQFEVRVKIVRAQGDRLFPAFDPRPQRPVDILKCALRYRVAALSERLRLAIGPPKKTTGS